MRARTVSAGAGLAVAAAVVERRALRAYGRRTRTRSKACMRRSTGGRDAGPGRRDVRRARCGCVGRCGRRAHPEAHAGPHSGAQAAAHPDARAWAIPSGYQPQCWRTRFSGRRAAESARRGSAPAHDGAGHAGLRSCALPDGWPGHGHGVQGPSAASGRRNRCRVVVGLMPRHAGSGSQPATRDAAVLPAGLYRRRYSCPASHRGSEEP